MSNQTEKTIADLLARYQYKYKDLTKRDIIGATSYFKDLAVKTDKYVYHTGIIKELVCLSGTIPVNFRNIVYNIPIQVFLSETYPYEAPISYVRPTPDMNVNISDTVDSSGRIYLPCINEWNHKNTDLYMLLNLMTIKFSEQTPLYSKVNTRYTNSNPSINTAYPTSNNNNNINISNSNTSSISSNIPPPYPTDYNRSNYNLPTSTSYPASFNQPSMPPYPTTTNPYYPMPTAQIKNNSVMNLNRNVLSTSSYPSNNPPPPPPPAQAINYSDDTIKPEHYRMSLISAAQHKIMLKYKEIYDEKIAEIDSLKRVKNDLEHSQQNLNILMNDVESECLNVKKMSEELKMKKNQLNEIINRIKYRSNANIEDVVVTTTPLYRQLLQLFAEEMSIQDLVFYLSDGLTHKTISLENFLKQIRFLSRKQFFLRATMQKARSQALLPN